MTGLRDLNHLRGGKRVLGTYRRGYLPSELPNDSGEDNPLLAGSLDPAKEYLWRITQFPATGDYFFFENGAFHFIPEQDGLETVAWTLVEDGEEIGFAYLYIQNGVVVQGILLSFNSSATISRFSLAVDINRFTSSGA